MEYVDRRRPGLQAWEARVIAAAFLLVLLVPGVHALGSKDGESRDPSSRDLGAYAQGPYGTAPEPSGSWSLVLPGRPQSETASTTSGSAAPQAPCPPDRRGSRGGRPGRQPGAGVPADRRGGQAPGRFPGLEQLPAHPGRLRDPGPVECRTEHVCRHARSLGRIPAGASRPPSPPS
ncbi:MAG: hypothetical protein MZV70_69540 [Desulfobacterales bacterium]|nr:hypothetical protein [Desulfobacterales bacterium]